MVVPYTVHCGQKVTVPVTLFASVLNLLMKLIKFFYKKIEKVLIKWFKGPVITTKPTILNPVFLESRYR